MDLDRAKLFIGGISWDTDELRLKDYFASYGDILDAVIIRDRTTGRARGFGFIVFADPCVAQRVLLDNHTIDGRTVEAKKAVPRDDQRTILASPGLGRTKKIFVGGLPSSLTDTDFKAYFHQFGTITDVVVMYDHNTQRPRGFGFITFDSEDAVDTVLHKTFHQLNGKMVEVKRAVPKEFSQGPGRSPLLLALNHGLGSRASNTLLSSSAYGVRMDARFNSIAADGFSPFANGGYGLGMNLEPASYGGFSNLTNTNLGYGRVLSPYYTNTNNVITPIGYNGRGGDSPLSSSLAARNVNVNVNVNVWGNDRFNSNPVSPGSGPPNWGFSSSSYISGNPTSYGTSTGGNMYGGGSFYGDSTWGSGSCEVDDDACGSFGGYNNNNAAAAMADKSSEEYIIGNYNRQSNRGIAA